MRRISIPLRGAATPGEVFGTARAVAVDHGYGWTQTGDRTARAFEGETEPTSASSMRLMIGLEVHDGELVLSQETTGHVSAAIGLGPLGQSGVKRSFEDMHRAFVEALDRAGLAG